jgi:hypothetical protein
MALVQEARIIILDEDTKRALREDVKRNGGKLIDPEFCELKKFLELNPLEGGARDRNTKDKQSL